MWNYGDGISIARLAVAATILPVALLARADRQRADLDGDQVADRHKRRLANADDRASDDVRFRRLDILRQARRDVEQRRERFIDARTAELFALGFVGPHDAHDAATVEWCRLVLRALKSCPEDELAATLGIMPGADARSAAGSLRQMIRYRSPTALDPLRIGQAAPPARATWTIG
jgi:hypothetical protein